MKFNQSNIKKAKKYREKNCCIGVPTETVYGLAGLGDLYVSVENDF